MLENPVKQHIHPYMKLQTLLKVMQINFFEAGFLLLRFIGVNIHICQTHLVFFQISVHHITCHSYSQGCRDGK